MTARRVLPALLLLFVGSGCAALIYEIVWFQLLQLVIGSSAVSMGVLLGTFMGGMCLGSLFLARVISPREHPLRVYAYLELGIGALRAAAALRDAPSWRASTSTGAAAVSREFCSEASPPASACCRRRWRWARPCRRCRAGSSPRQKASPGSGSSMAATSPAASSAVCSPGSTCFASTTPRLRHLWRSA